MCLSVVYRGRRKKEALAKLPESGYYWKVVKKFDGKYWPRFWNSKSFKNGWNNTKGIYNRAGYKIAFHLFHTKKDAKMYEDFYPIIRCRLHKKDICAIGEQRGCNSYSSYDLLAIVTTRFWCPKPRRKK